jgi:dTDP-4-dehydrorhamnose reductase
MPGASWYQLDLRTLGQIDEVLATVAPTAVITATSGGDDRMVTADGSFRVAAAATKRSCLLVHPSSDAEFSGSRIHYDETRLPDPLTAYGAAKATAATAVRLLAPAGAVARTSSIIGQGQIRTCAHAGTRDGVPFTDDIGRPVHAQDLASAGMFHLAAADALSRHELGVHFARRDGLEATRLSGPGHPPRREQRHRRARAVRRHPRAAPANHQATR